MRHEMRFPTIASFAMPRCRLVSHWKVSEPSGILLLPRLGCTRDPAVRENGFYAMSFSVPQIDAPVLEPWAPCAYNEFGNRPVAGIQSVLDEVTKVNNRAFRIPAYLKTFPLEPPGCQQKVLVPKRRPFLHIRCPQASGHHAG